LLQVPTNKSAGGSIDLNTITESGMYRLEASLSNSPAASAEYGQMLVVHGSGDTIAQMIFPYSSSGTVYVRSGNPSNVGGSGSWGSWVKLSGDAATESVAGIVELATTAEAAAGTSTTHAVTPAGVLEAKKLGNSTGTNSTNGSQEKGITGIPSWARKITVAYSGLSSTATSDFRLDLGDSGGYETGVTFETGIAAGSSTTGVLTVVNLTGNSWTNASGTQTTSATVDRLRVFSVSGTFDAGTVTAYWE
jgi:hypothetical protein